MICSCTQNLFFQVVIWEFSISKSAYWCFLIITSRWSITIDSKVYSVQHVTSLISDMFGKIGFLAMDKLNMADSRFASTQWETSLQINAVSHWLGANLESARSYIPQYNVECNYLYMPYTMNWYLWIRNIILHYLGGVFDNPDASYWCTYPSIDKWFLYFPWQLVIPKE